ncbi:UDP-2,3-diacylglucosamine diphosphatase [Aquabacterium sp.]|uniref:UDP-2,3-diacylglucosamine diphosphatase n=1 Tax=Aquabacterium sp. TaxID=1872578 RepID=UPI0040379BF4
MPDVKGATPPFPPSDTLHAPPSWRCIDFISDLHLHEGLPRTTRALASYLASTPADAVFMLGDVFEAWVGDDMRGQPYEAACVEFLAQAGSRLHLAIMVGNRDFLLGDAMLAACNAHKLHDPTVLHAFGQPMLLIHGDELCLSDQAYLKFRAQVRHPQWQHAFLAHPLEARLAQARQMREASQMHQHAQAPENWADVDEATATQWMQAAGATALIHGHTHRPCDQAFGPAGAMRHVLSDWDLDHGHARAEVLRLTENGLQRLALNA